ncbi:MAG TPA: DinB family protein [Acidobacteriota bacterium]|nr:DinB family protein [Acidobacteriota bacterium]
MTPEEIKAALEAMREYFNRSTRPLQEEHSTFAPREGLYTVAGQVAHVAQTVEWFAEAAFGDNWRMEFEAMDKEVRDVTSLAAARAWFEKAVDAAICVAQSHTQEEWASRFPPNPIVGEVPRYTVVGAITEHTAHHRGALTVYQRLLGLTPPMPYADM